MRAVNALGSASISDIHKETGLHKSTILRMLETLIHEEYVIRLPKETQYTVTGKCLLLSSGYSLHSSLARLAEPYLSAFRRYTGWPSDVAIFDHNAMIIAATNREFGTMSLNRQVGARVPILASSLGRAYLAFCPQEEVESLLQRLASSGNPFDSAARNKGKVMRMLRETRKRGYATPDEEYTERVYQNQITGFSAPIFSRETVIGSVNVMYHRASTSPGHAADTLLPALKQLASKISDAVAQDRGVASSPKAA